MPEPIPDDAAPIERLKSIMRTLRSDAGCPWDRKQTLASLKPFVIEEAYEVLDAIDAGDRDALCGELGDVLLQVVFQSQLCAEEGSFTFDDVAARICDKLIRRHPHVFADVDVADAEEVLQNWDAIKKEEGGAGTPRSAVDGLPRHLPALHKAYETQKRAARQGFDWKEIDDVVRKLDEEVEELKQAIAHDDADEARAELGDLLFSAVNLSRFLGHQPEDVLHRTIQKFVRRFQAVELRVEAAGQRMSDLSIEDLDAHWDAVKAAEEGSEKK